ncbi:MAG: RNA 2'-O ribose methyltransferase substrate binding family protein [Candidatus Xenolissoclinum pacificiensis L6]|uniref:RNA 2'-O ribose methyltransferase substrate binding family protein n=1 Tax=Candidatus Xenolissoclinum pacificiensis L6 TaxID=1401685 RepID=W2V102_9RICK|nr:MAG: RNA 2'-O ribose methyltransferase substrate binding family protein [Candidatus Xenolissoclinum pacificiensis L6]
MQNHQIIYGKYSCINAIKAKKRKIYKIFITEKRLNNDFYQILDIHDPRLQITSDNQIRNFFKSKETINHQGVCMFVSSIEFLSLQQIKNLCNPILVLDHITDVNNIGAIIRTAYAFNAYVMVKKHASINLSSMGISKCSSGAIEYANIIQTPNLSRAVQELKNQQYWLYSLSATAKDSIHAYKFPRKSIFIFGSEEKGISRLLQNISDATVSIKINRNIDSLNVSNSCAITLYQYRTLFPD